CYGEPFFVKRRASRIAAIAHRFKGRIDLAECALSHGSVPPPLGKEHQRDAFIAKTPGPAARARGFVLSTLRDRRRQPLRASSSHFPAPQGAQAQGPDCSASWPIGAARARASSPSAPRETSRRPLRALPSRSRVFQDRKAHSPDRSG